MRRIRKKAQKREGKDSSTKPWFIVSIAITILLVVLIGWNLLFSYNTVNSFKNRELAIERNSWKLLLYAETMKMATRLSAASGNLKWKKTYSNTKPRLKQVLQEIPALVPSKEIQRKIKEIRTYLENISKIETRAYDLVSRGKKEEAVTLLAGWEYTKNQNKFNNATKELVNIIQSRIKNKTSFQKSQTLVFVFFTLGCLAILTLAWSVTIKLWRNNLKRRKEAEEKISQLLNNSGQGFMLIDEDLRVDPNYSRECINMFLTDVGREKIQDLFYPEQSFQKEHFAKTISNLLEEEDDLKRETIISLLPGSFFINNKYLQVEYRLLANRQIMLIITDVTEKIQLEQKIEREHKRLSFIVSALENKNELISSISEYEDFIHREFALLIHGSQGIEEKLNAIFRKTHTFKGTLNQYEFPYSPELLHQIEKTLSDIIHNNKEMDVQNLEQLFPKEDLQYALDRDKAILEESLGSEFLSGFKEITVPAESFLQLQRDLEDILRNPESMQQMQVSLRGLLNRIKRLRFSNLKDLLAKYSKYLNQLSTRLEKSIYPLEISGKDVYVDPNDFRPFVQSLVHIFRNSLAHGIEDPDFRIDMDKEEEGLIYCKIEQNDAGFSLCIGDDGQGIDREALRAKVLESGIYTERQLDMLTEQEFFGLIFSANLSSKNDSDSLSGMGMGLNAVREEAHKLNAEIEIYSKKSRGTEFRFYFPLSAESMLNPNL